jgi:hypothetical protein
MSSNTAYSKAEFDAKVADLRTSYTALAGENPESWYTKCVIEELQTTYKKVADEAPRSFRKRGCRGGGKKTTPKQ